MAGGDAIQVTSASSSTGTITLSATPTDAFHQAFPASFDGQPISVRIEHSSIQAQFEIVRGVYTHSTRAFTRPAANVTFGTAGAGANTDFSPGGLVVSVIAKWGDLADLFSSYQAVTAAAAQAGYQITRGSANILVELTEDLTAAATFAMPTSPQDGDRVLVDRQAGGAFDWSNSTLGVNLGYRGDAALFLRDSSAWRTFRLPGRTRARREATGRSFTVDDGGAIIAATASDTWTIPDAVGQSTGFQVTLLQRGANPATLALGAGLTQVGGLASLVTDGDGNALLAQAIGNSEVLVRSVVVGFGALAFLDTVGSAQIDAGAVGPTQLAVTSVVAGSYTVASITVDAQGRITSAASGSGDLALVLESATAVTVGANTDGEFNILTAATSITLTLDAQATVGMRGAFQPGGAGAVTVAVEAGAGYWLPGDNIGGSIRTTSFTLVGYGYLECIRNTDTNSAEWIFVGNSNHAQSLSAALDAADQVISAPELKDVAETVVAKGTLATGAISYDYTAGGWQWGTTGGGNITSVSITNPPATGKLGCLTLEFVQGATPRTIAWGAAFRFPGGTDFTLTASTGAVDVFTFITRDGGTTWYGFEGGKALAA